MKIESILRRKNGTKTTLGLTTYHFAPTDTDPRHIAEVTDKAHIQRFLSIPEGFRLVDAAPAAKSEPANKPIKQAEPLLGHDLNPAEIEIAGQSYKTVELVTAAFTESGLSIDDWNAQGMEQVQAILDAKVEKIAADAVVEGAGNAANAAATGEAPAATGDNQAPAGSPEKEVTKDELIAQAKELGIPATKNWGVPKLTEAIAAAKAQG